MPEEFVKKIFYKLVDVEPEDIESRHIVKMNNYFKVSYRAMLKRLIQLHLCDYKKYEKLRSMSSLEKKMNYKR